jgi:hypothetical protein
MLSHCVAFKEGGRVWASTGFVLVATLWQNSLFCDIIGITFHGSNLFKNCIPSQDVD